MNKFFLSSFIIFCFFEASAQSIIYGKNSFTTISEGVVREYVVHVPKIYDGSKGVPLVFMLHGTGGSGPDFYENIGWKELSEKENFIVVYPSSLKYKIIDEEGPKVTFKWNSTPDGGFELQVGEVAKDDIKFLRKVITEISSKYNIDEKRIYLNGFSNGGSMAAKCAIEMGDVLAAVCQNASSFFLDTTFIPKRKLPVLYEVGNKDYGPGNEGPSIPMALFDSLISTPNVAYLNGKHYRIANLTQRHFDLQTEHTIEGDSNIALVATFLPKPNTGGYEYKYIMVKNLAHNYPNGAFHNYNAPLLHWNWMKNFTLENVPAKTQSLKVVNGHGSGTYVVGDTIHIWASTPESSKTFSTWAGDVSVLEEKTNWHTTLIMPDESITIEARYMVLPANLTFQQEIIQGPISKKEVYTYFPSKDKIKGIVWLFQGSGGFGKFWVSRTEDKSLLELLAANDFGIITMDAEESTQGSDLNKDGSNSFQYDPDTINNPDLVNVKFIKNHFLNQDKFFPNTPQIAFGFSSGGGFAEVLAAVYGWSCSLSHNTGGVDFTANNSLVPHYQNNSFNDDGPNVGVIGNNKAITNYQKYLERNVKSVMIIQQPQPLHSERFTRIPGVDAEQASAIFNFIKQKGLLNDHSYVVSNPELIQKEYESNPTNFPQLSSLPEKLINEIFVQLKVVYTLHIFRSDYNGSALKFINESIDHTTAVVDSKRNQQLLIYPNPATTNVFLPEEMNYEIYDLNGNLVTKGRGRDVNVESLNEGLFLLRANEHFGYLTIIR